MILLNEYLKDRQILINTHSPYFIDIHSLINGANLYRTVKNLHGDIELYSLSNESKDNLKSFLKDINQPHTLETEAKELFFLEDKIILVERPGNVIMYSIAAETIGIDLNGSFFWVVVSAEHQKFLKS